LAKKETALRRRITPSVPLQLKMADENGETFTLDLRLSFDMNAGMAIQKRTGINIHDLSMWKDVDEPLFLAGVLWGAVLSRHPEYDTEDATGESTDEGLKAIGSYIDDSNRDAVAEALWNAHMLYLSPERRAFMETLKAKEEAARQARMRGEAGEPDPPKPAPSRPETETAESSSAGPTSGPSPDTTSASPIANSAS